MIVLGLGDLSASAIQFGFNAPVHGSVSAPINPNLNLNYQTQSPNNLTVCATEHAQVDSVHLFANQGSLTFEDDSGELVCAFNIVLKKNSECEDGLDSTKPTAWPSKPRSLSIKSDQQAPQITKAYPNVVLGDALPLGKNESLYCAGAFPLVGAGLTAFTPTFLNSNQSGSIKESIKESESVPEPSTIIGTLLAGGYGIYRRKR